MVRRYSCAMPTNPDSPTAADEEESMWNEFDNPGDDWSQQLLLDSSQPSVRSKSMALLSEDVRHGMLASTVILCQSSLLTYSDHSGQRPQKTLLFGSLDSDSWSRGRTRPDITTSKGKERLRGVSQFEARERRYVYSYQVEGPFLTCSVTETPHSNTAHRDILDPHPRSSSSSSRQGTQPLFRSITPNAYPRNSFGPSTQASQPQFRTVSQSTSMHPGFGYEWQGWNPPPSNPRVAPNQGYVSREHSRPRSRRKYTEYRCVSPADRCPQTADSVTSSRGESLTNVLNQDREETLTRAEITQNNYNNQVNFMEMLGSVGCIFCLLIGFSETHLTERCPRAQAWPSVTITPALFPSAVKDWSRMMPFFQGGDKNSCGHCRFPKLDDFHHKYRNSMCKYNDFLNRTAWALWHNSDFHNTVYKYSEQYSRVTIHIPTMKKVDFQRWLLEEVSPGESHLYQIFSMIVRVSSPLLFPLLKY